MADLLTSPPSKLSSVDLASKFPCMRNSPNLLHLLEKNAGSNTPIQKRESVRNFPANIVSERQAFFSKEITSEIAILESSNEWPEICAFVKSFLNITLVSSSPSEQDVPTTANNGKPTPPPQHPKLSITTSISDKDVTSEMDSPVELFGLHPSVHNCLKLLPQLIRKWGSPQSHSFLTLSTSISQFLFHWKSVTQLISRTRSLKSIDLSEVNFTLVRAVLDEMKSDSQAPGSVSYQTILSWKPQLLLLFSRAQNILNQVRTCQEREFGQVHVGKIRKQLFTVVSKFLYTQNFSKLDHEHRLLHDIMSGSALINLVVAITVSANERARKLDLQPPFSHTDPLKPIPLPQDGNSLVCVTKNWLALSRAAEQLLHIDFGAWNIRPLSIAKAVGPVLSMIPQTATDGGTISISDLEIPFDISSAIETATILLGMRYAQLATASPLMLKLEDLTLFRNCVQLSGGSVGSPIGLPFSLIPTNASDLVSTSSNPNVFIGPMGFYQKWDLNYPALPLGKGVLPIRRVSEIEAKSDAQEVWLFHRYLRILDTLLDKNESTKIPNLVRVTHMEVPSLCQPPIPIEDVSRDWMPSQTSIYLHIDANQAKPEMSRSLSSFLLRWHTLKLEPTSRKNLIRVDRTRAYTTNQVILEIFQRVTETLVAMHEKSHLAHGGLSLDTILVLGNDSDFDGQTNQFEINLLVPKLHMDLQVGYEPRLGMGFDEESTLANDVFALGKVFANVMDKFWYHRPAIEVKQAMDDLVLRKRMIQFDNEPKNSLGMRPSHEHRRPQSMMIFRSPEMHDARTKRYSTMTAQRQRKKRPITIHLAPSIHPPWSPMYNDQITTVIQPPPDSPNAQTEEDEGFSGTASPLSSVPEIVVVEEETEKVLMQQVPYSEEDFRMSDLVQKMKGLVQSMCAGNVSARPRMGQVLEYLQ